MRSNVKAPVTPPERTHGGAIASRITPEQQLRRSVMACLLFEDEFYEDGITIKERIKELVPKVRPEAVFQIAVEARSKMKIRHTPLFIAYCMTLHTSHRTLVGKLLPEIIQRPDELTEFLAIYKREGGKKLSAQTKKGLARAFTKFDEYQFAKWRGDKNEWQLRDALFLCHAKPTDGREGYNKAARKAKKRVVLKPGEKLFKAIVNKELRRHDTWEDQLSAGADKKETFETLMRDRKLGVVAFLRNLRNMQQAGVARDLIRTYSKNVPVERALPFQFLTAARAVPGYEDILEPMMLRCLEGLPKLTGKTVLIVDVSGSMGAQLGGRSTLTRLDVAGALAVLARELCEEPYIFATAGNDYTRQHQTGLIPPRRGFALIDKVARDAARKLGGGGIFLVQVMQAVKEHLKNGGIDTNNIARTIVLTDEVDCDISRDPKSADAFGKQNFIINVASAKNGIGYGKFTHVDGWSEHVFDYINYYETIPQQ